MAASDEAAIRQLVDDLTKAWDRGDAEGFGARFHADGTFTNVNGTFHLGRAAFERRHQDVFGSVFRGTTLTHAIRSLRYVTSDVAVVDIETTIANYKGGMPSAVADENGALHSSLLMVLVREASAWWISAYHNVWRAPVR